MPVDMLAIWNASPIEQAWHAAITASVEHDSQCDQCTEAVVRADQRYCPDGQALRDFEEAAWRASRADVYVPLALKRGKP